MTNPLPIETETVAVFDFDGTLTYRDTLLSFLFFVCGTKKTLNRLFYLAPHFFKYACGMISRQEMKEKVLKRFFAGIPIEVMQDLGKAFAEGPLNTHLRPKALPRIKWHLDQGHRCILISASLNVYLHPWARYAGFHDAITSELAVDDKGRVTGLLAGKNCWGEEKTRRLIELLGPRKNFILYAYGDSKGDAPLLKMANYPFYKSLE